MGDGEVPAVWRAVIHAAKENRQKNRGSPPPRLEQHAMRFVEFVVDEINRELVPQARFERRFAHPIMSNGLQWLALLITL